MMRMVLVSALSLGATVAAEARTDTRNLSCNQAQSLVQQQGSVTLSTGANTFARFVSSRRFCGIQSRTAPQYVPTTDNRQCPLMTCRSQGGSDGRR